MCYGFPCTWWNGGSETCSKPRGEDCPEMLAADMPPDDECIPAPPPRVGRLGSGFWVSCKLHQLQEVLSRLQDEWGDDPRSWGKRRAA